MSYLKFGNVGVDNELVLIDYNVLINIDELIDLNRKKEKDPISNAELLTQINFIMRGNYDKLIDIFNKKNNNIDLSDDELELSFTSKISIKQIIPLFSISGARNLMEYEQKNSKSLVLNK